MANKRVYEATGHNVRSAWPLNVGFYRQVFRANPASAATQHADWETLSCYTRFVSACAKLLTSISRSSDSLLPKTVDGIRPMSSPPPIPCSSDSVSPCPIRRRHVDDQLSRPPCSAASNSVRGHGPLGERREDGGSKTRPVILSDAPPPLYSCCLCCYRHARNQV
jgi:hypothetical protein